MLKHRVISGTVIVIALLIAMVVARPWVALLVMAGIAALALREYYHLLDAAHIPNFRIVGTLAGLGLLAASWWALRHDAGHPLREDADALAIAIAAGTLFVRQFFARDNPRPLETLAGSLLGLMYICVPLMFFLRVVMMDGGVGGRWLLLYMIVVVKSTDIGAFFTGRAIGRHKLIPRISPAKTWEGVLGGVATGVAVSVAWVLFAGGDFGVANIPLGHAVLLGFVLAVAGVMGDLAESLLKRSAGVKDSSTIIAGMGGVLDVVDSLLPAGPLLYLYVRHIL
jgi:phosphatidate cytidylyltransferase